MYNNKTLLCTIIRYCYKLQNIRVSSYRPGYHDFLHPLFTYLRARLVIQKPLSIHKIWSHPSGSPGLGKGQTGNTCQVSMKGLLCAPGDEGDSSSGRKCLSRSTIEKGQTTRKEREFQTEGKAGTTSVERERVWMGQGCGVTAVGCAQDRGQGKAVRPPQESPPVPWGIWTSSSGSRYGGIRGKGEVSRKEKRDYLRMNQRPFQSPSNSHTTSHSRGWKDSYCRM